VDREDRRSVCGEPIAEESFLGVLLPLLALLPILYLLFVCMAAW